MVCIKLLIFLQALYLTGKLNNIKDFPIKCISFYICTTITTACITNAYDMNITDTTTNNTTTMCGFRGGGGGVPGVRTPPPPPPEFWQKCGYQVREWDRFHIEQHLCWIQS